MYSKTFIPYGAYYSSPFARWQGSLQNENSIVLGATTAKRWLAAKNMDVNQFEYIYLGKTVGQPYTFYAGPYAAALMGADRTTACHIPQACSTSTTVINIAAMGLETDMYKKVFCLMTDKLSNAPHTIWPNPKGPGGEVISENWAMDHFNRDPYGGVAMIQTAENVINKAGGITKEDCDEATFRRFEQYQDSLANDRAFQKRFMFPIELKKGKKQTVLFEADEGVNPMTKEGLAKLKPAIPGGALTFGSQTHPADGNAGIVLCNQEDAQELSTDKNITIQMLSYGYSRAEKAHMAMAIVPAAEMAMDKAGIKVGDCKVVKNHNPFIANDLYLANTLNIDVMKFNNYGSSLIYGHPQAPTAGRGIMEMIEELVILGGGYGLFTGCAAGDTGAALVLKVS